MSLVSKSSPLARSLSYNLPAYFATIIPLDKLISVFPVPHTKKHCFNLGCTTFVQYFYGGFFYITKSILPIALHLLPYSAPSFLQNRLRHAFCG